MLATTTACAHELHLQFNREGPVHTPLDRVQSRYVWLACRQMKRLYSECSQEEDPLQLMTPAEIAAQPEQVSMHLNAMSCNFTQTMLLQSSRPPQHHV